MHNYLGLTTGITMAGSGLGSLSMAPLGTYLLAKFNWDVTMIILGAMILQCCIMGALLRPVPTRIKY